MKLLSINKVGCIDSIVDEVDLGNLSFIYGLNGSGKSTIKDLLRKSFFPGDKLASSFGATPSSCNAEVKIFTKNVKFEKSKVVTPISSKISLHVFDERYIEENIYVNGSVTDSNKKEYFRMFVGDNVNSKITIALNRTLDTQKSKSELVKELEKIKTQNNELHDFLELIEVMKQKLNLEYNLTYIIETVVKRDIQNNVNCIDKRSIEWLKTGIKIRKNSEICPYCGQNISEEINLRLIDHYARIVLESQAEEMRIKEDLDRLKDNIIRKDFSSASAIYDNGILSAIQEICRSNIELKKENISEKINIDIDHLSQLKQKNQNIFSFLEQFETYIAQLEIINLFELPDIEIEASNIQNLRKRIDNIVVNETSKQILNDEIIKLFKANKDARARISSIDDLQRASLELHIIELNKKLKMYGFKYTIKFKRLEQKNLAKSNHAHLKLCLIPNSSPATSQDIDKDAIKGILSEGEKSILAWVFFMVDLEKRLQSGNHLIIIDDPISSYDSFKRFYLMHDIKRIHKSISSTEILVLSHEKGFLNVFSHFPKCKYFNMIDGKIISIDPKVINEDDIKNDLDFIRENCTMQLNEKFIEFIIRSRNIIQYNKQFNDSIGAKFFRISKYNENFGIASSLIHFQSNLLPTSYFQYVSSVYKKITTNSIQFDYSAINLTDINLADLIVNPSSNIYLARMKINKHLINCLLSNNKPMPVHEETTGDILALCKGLLDEETFNRIDYYLPLLNVYNHPNEKLGLRRIDCSEISKNDLFDFANNLL